MSKRAKIILVVSILVLALTAAATQGSLVGSVVKAGAIAVVVDRFGGQINDFVNKLTANKNVGTDQATAVVPILSLGGGGYIGAAQVMGAKANVDQVKAVVQIEGNAVFGRNIRVKALVPIGSRSTNDIKRIPGVGISAIIDIRI